MCDSRISCIATPETALETLEALENKTDLTIKYFQLEINKANVLEINIFF